MATEKQIEANRQNALKSTGPKTPEGKARSRRNSLKHGLTGAGVVLRKKDAQEIAQRITAFSQKLAPCDELEQDLVERVAVASVRTRRCVKLELSDLAKRRRRAWQRWEKKQAAAVGEAASRLTHEPGAAVRALKAKALGCDWLLAAWHAIADALAAQGGLTASQTAEILQLLGKEPQGAYPADELVINLRKHAMAALCEGTSVEMPMPDAGTCSDEQAAQTIVDGPECFGAAFASVEDLPEIGEARAWLMALIESQCAELAQLRDTAWQETDGPDLAEAQDRILVDTSEKGIRLLRYENSADMTLHRNLNQLIAIRKMEPACHTITRQQSRGQHPSRVWNGTDWLLWRDYEAMLTGRDPHQAEADVELKRSGWVRSTTEAGQFEGMPTADGGDSESGGSFADSTQAVASEALPAGDRVGDRDSATASRDRCEPATAAAVGAEGAAETASADAAEVNAPTAVPVDPAAARIRCENEADSADSSAAATTSSVQPPEWSRTEFEPAAQSAPKAPARPRETETPGTGRQPGATGGTSHID